MITHISRNTVSFPFTGSVTDGQLDFYEEYGFIVYREVFPESEVRLIKDDVRELEQRTFANEIPEEHRDRVLPPSKDEHGDLHLNRLLYMTRYSPRTRKLIAQQNLEALGTSLIGPHSWLLDDTMGGSILQQKFGSGKSSYSAIDWHLDWPEEDVLVPVVTVGIYLDASTVDNGCVIMLPGSHRYPLGRISQTPLAIEASAGDVVCHAYNILHESGPIPEGQSRATLYLYFCGGNYPGKDIPFNTEERENEIRTLYSGHRAVGEATGG